ncbi:hypothetical protein [Nocardia asteroides]|nr:hypothetical protein [Nocardia asteroides]UGT57233.1 hypothetical protein LTT85_10485 [Nocardia asteroides]
MANGEGSDSEPSGGASSGGADAPLPPMPHRHADPSVAPSLLGSHQAVTHRGRPRWSTIALVLIFASALVLYLALRPGG